MDSTGDLPERGCLLVMLPRLSLFGAFVKPPSTRR
jgi:hypothetical protein